MTRIAASAIFGELVGFWKPPEFYTLLNTYLPQYH